MSENHKVIEIKVRLKTDELVIKYKVEGQWPSINYDTFEEAQCIADELNALEPEPKSPRPSRSFSPF